MRPLVPFLPAVIYAAIIFALSAQSNPLQFLPPELLLQDKLLHTIEYAALGALLVPALRLTGLSWAPALVLAVVLASLYGATDEFHQSFVPGRNADVLDWVAETLGAALGAVAATVATGALRRAGGAG